MKMDFGEAVERDEQVGYLVQSESTGLAIPQVIIDLSHRSGRQNAIQVFVDRFLAEVGSFTHVA